MRLRVPNTLNAANAENYHVSIRLWSDGLSFSGYIPDDKNSFFTDKVELKSDVQMVQSLKHVFFNNTCLSYLFRSFQVIYVSETYTMAPEALFSGKERNELFSFCFQEAKEAKVLVQPLSAIHAYLIYSIDTEAYEFLMRSLINPVFVHFLSNMLLAWQKKSLTCHRKQLYIMLRTSVMDLSCFERGEMLYLNAFEHENQAGIVYFLMYACQQLGLNQLEDQLYFCGDQEICRSVMKHVARYFRHTFYLHLQLEKYELGADQSLFIDEIIQGE